MNTAYTTWGLYIDWREFLCKVQHLFVVLLSVSDVSASVASFSEMSDNELAGAAKHNVNAFNELFDRFFTRVYQFHFSRIRQKQDAEDLTSETFAKIFKKLEGYNERGVPFSVWVFTIARNTLIDHIRKNKIQTEPLEDMESYKEPYVHFDMRKIENKILTEKLWKTLRVLPEMQQQIWALKLASDLPHKEIAAIVGISENNVNVHVSRSMKTLKKYLQHLKP